MNRTFLTMLALLLPVAILSAQSLSFSELRKADQRFTGTFKSYTSAEGHTFKVGDTLVLGSPKGMESCFEYVWSGDGAAAIRDIQGRKLKINKFRVRGNPRYGFYAVAWVPAQGNDFYRIDLENAMKYGEVREPDSF
jgi:hypothetical protein